MSQIRALFQPHRLKATLSSGAALALLCCVAPLLLGAACLLALGLAIEVVLAGVLLAGVALTVRRQALRRRRTADRLELEGR